MPVTMQMMEKMAKRAASASPEKPKDVLIPGKPEWPAGHENFKPIFEGPRTDKSMALAHSSATEVPKYRDEVKGIVPGYQGHVPRSRDQYGESAVGGLQPTPWGNTRHMGAAEGHNTNAMGQLELMKEERLHQKEEERFADYEKRNGGVMPNYAGHRPGARAVEAKSAYSKVTRPGKPSSWAFNDTADFTGDSGNSAATTGSQTSYRKQVNGIVPGYKGFVPGAVDKAGGSHFGGIKGVDRATGLNTIAAKVDEEGDFYGLNQKGHGRDYKEQHTAGGVKSGYAGHLPGARETWGITHYDTVNMGADGRLHGRKRFVNDQDTTNNFTLQQKDYHDHVSQAMTDGGETLQQSSGTYKN